MMSDIDKDIEILKEIQEELNKDVCMEKNNLIRKEKWREQAQAIENVLWALNGKDCVIETQTHNEEVLEEYVAKLEVELDTYKKMSKKLAEKVEEIAYEMHLDEIYAKLHNCEGIERNWTRGKEAEVKDILDWARKEVDSNEEK